MGLRFRMLIQTNRWEFELPLPEKRNLLIPVTFAGLLVPVVAIIAVVTKLWFLTAVPIGFLFGFFLQKGDLCGASAFSEVILLRDRRKLFGLWVAIVTAMAGFSMLELTGWVPLWVKPTYWLAAIVGGVLFGIGMVLAGGCISGCLYKGAAGNLNSIMALLTIPVGLVIAVYGPLSGFRKTLESDAIYNAQMENPSLPAATHMPMWQWALVFAALTIAGVVVARFRKKEAVRKPRIEHDGFLKRALLRPWKPWVSGMLIGLLAFAGYLSSSASGRDYTLCVVTGVLSTEVLAFESEPIHIFKPLTWEQEEALDGIDGPPGKPVYWWLVLFVAATIPGSLVSAKLSGQAKLLPKPPEQLLTALVGGLLSGLGVGLAGGCVIGNIVMGLAHFSLGMLIFAVATILANWATTYIYLMGANR